MVVEPLFRARIGLRLATRLAIRANRRGLPNDSRYRAIAAVSGSSSQYSSRSFDDTSALLPTETNADRPRPRWEASSITARPTAPLCDEMATFPGSNWRREKVAFIIGPDANTPRQFGPTMRAPCERTSASRSASALAPAGPVSAKPAEITQTAFAPAPSASATAPCTAPDGTAMTARSTRVGSSATDACDGWPATGSPERFTG